MKRLEDHQSVRRPVAPAAAGVLLPATNEAGPSVGAQSCPPLAELLETVTEIDRLQARAIEQVARLQVSNEDLEHTGLAADVWLAVEGRMTRTDRRMLAAVAEHLGRLPLAAREFTRGGLSWSQLRTIVTMLVRDHKVCADEWEAVDAAIATAVGQANDDDPDEVVRLVRDWLYARRPEKVEEAESEATDGRFLALQPKLDGLGGLRFWGETDAAGAALLESITRPGLDQLPHAPGLSAVARMGRARHDQLMAHLVSTAGATAGSSSTALLTMSYETLVGLSQVNAELLVDLTGGRLKVSASTARRLLAEGFDTRLIVLDETGQVLGVGRRHRKPPDWFRDALLVRDRTCTHPLCERPGLSCQADHAIPWNMGGATDINNLGLVCGPHNRTKERTGWKVKGHDDGSRTWHHPRSGLTIRTRPATRRLMPPGPTPRSPEPPSQGADAWPSPPAGADPPF